MAQSNKKITMQSSRRIPLSIDGIGIGISGACIVHCLFLPLIISLLPVLESWAEAEWVHQIMVLLAVPVAGFALFKISQRRFLIGTIMIVGILFLLAGAFLPFLHAYETPLTVSGALMLSGGHLLRWQDIKAHG